MRWPFIRILTIVFALSAAALIVLGWWRGENIGITNASSAALSKQAEFDLTSLTPDVAAEHSFDDILARPVFSATRRPFVSPPPPEPLPPPPPPPVPVPQIVEVPEPPPVIETPPVAAPPEPPPQPEPPVIAEIPAPSPALASPPEPVKVEIVEPQLDPTILRLQGTMSANGVSKALIVAPDAPQGRWIKEGETISGWTLAKVSRYNAVFKAKKQSTTIELYVDKKPAAVGVTQPGG